MFKGFLKSGQARTTVANNQMFAGFPSLSFGNNGNIGGIPTTGLMAWFNPSVNITLDGSGNVSQWQDTSATYTFAQSTSTARPAYVQGDSTYNYRPYSTFNGTNQYLTGASGLSLQGNTTWQVIIVAKHNSPTNNDRLLQSDIISNDGSYCVVGVNAIPNWLYQYTNDSGTDIATSSGIGTDTKLHMFSIEIDRAVTGKQYWSMDSVWRTSSVTIGNSSTVYSSASITLGVSSAISIFTNAFVFDIFFYNSLLSKSDYLMLRGYMGSLYGF
jgi:hypothetical protein